ncbi:MAG TPA: hypothetical protein VMV80_06620 [Anaerolineales bacterium]|nr:hypothetical protein [Anaerolineales bacterium]
MTVNKEVAIIGTQDVTRGFTPWDRTDVDFWLCNDAIYFEWVKKIDLLFEMHDRADHTDQDKYNYKEYPDWLKEEHPFYIMMQEFYPDMPSSVRYPMEAVCDKLLPGLLRISDTHEIKQKYFTSSAAYQIALAIFSGQYKRIGLYGIEMMTKTEYQEQRDCVMFWAGLALGRGIEVVVPDISSLFRGALYGYETEVAIYGSEFDKAAEALKPEVEKQKSVMDKAIGATQYALAIFQEAKNDEENAIRSKQFFESLEKQHKAIFNYGRVSGALEETLYYRDITDTKFKVQRGEMTLLEKETGDRYGTEI